MAHDIERLLMLPQYCAAITAGTDSRLQPNGQQKASLATPLAAQAPNDDTSLLTSSCGNVALMSPLELPTSGGGYCDRRFDFSRTAASAPRIALSSAAVMRVNDTKPVVSFDDNKNVDERAIVHTTLMQQNAAELLYQHEYNTNNSSKTLSSPIVGEQHNCNSQRRRRRRAERKPVPDECKDGKYFERRSRNNYAAKKSRDARKAREEDVAQAADRLEKLNAVLRAQVATLREEAVSLRDLVGRKKLQQQKACQTSLLCTSLPQFYQQQQLLAASSMQTSPISPSAPISVRDLLGYNNTNACSKTAATISEHGDDAAAVGRFAGELYRSHVLFHAQPRLPAEKAAVTTNTFDFSATMKTS